MPSDGRPKNVNRRCYCGACSVSGGAVQIVACCHCSDCRRWTGAPASAFTAIDTASFTLLDGVNLYAGPAGTQRGNFKACGSPLTFTYAYLPDQKYLPFGTLGQASTLSPQLHANEGARLNWLHIADSLPRSVGSARDTLNNPR